MDATSQKLTGVISKENQQNMNLASWKLTGEEKLGPTTHQVGKLRVKHINECMLSEVDWGAHGSSFFLYLVHIDHDAKPKDFFTQGLWGGLPQRTSSTPLMESLKDSFDTGQIEDGFSNSKSIKGYRSSYPLPDPEQHESSYNLPTQWDHGDKPLQPPLLRKESTSELTAKTKGSDRIFVTNLGSSQSLMVQRGTPNLH